MGRELWYVAVDDGGRLLRRARSDPAFGEYLMVPSYFGPERWRGTCRGLHAEFLAEVDEMNRSHPGIERRIFTLDRYFDKLHYLLSEERRRGEFDGADRGTKSILGGRSLPEHLRGGQGHPIRYSPPGEVIEVASWLGGLTAGEIRSAYSPEEMEEQGVYKHRAGQDDDRAWDWIIGYFEGLRAFYADTASHGEGALVVVT